MGVGIGGDGKKKKKKAIFLFILSVAEKVSLHGIGLGGIECLNLIWMVWGMESLSMSSVVGQCLARAFVLI